MLLSPLQLERYAEVLIWGLGAERKRKLEAYDALVLRSDLAALPLAEVLYRKLIRRRFHVIPRFSTSPVMEKDFFTFSDSAQRRRIDAWEKGFYGSLHGLISLHAPSSLTHLKGVDPGRLSESAIARKPLRDIWDKREAQGRFSWTLCTYPTEELARQARLSLKAYAGQIVKACLLDDKDPVRRWRDMYRDCLGIKQWLKSLAMDTIRVETKSMDLELSLGRRRRFQGISGANIPSFEVFTSPDWRGTRGSYFANLPSFRSGNIVRGVRLEFRAGKVVKAAAAQGEVFLKKTLAADPGACRIGEFSLTDVRFSKIDKFMADTLFDENFGGRHGNCHVAVGASYADTFDGDPARLTPALKRELGFNESSVHWDIINTENKRVTASLRRGGRVTIYENGRFCC